MTFRPFIRIGRTNGVVNIGVDTLLATDRPIYWFEIRPDNEITAILIENHLSETLHALVRNAREEAYAEGYRHGRGKQAKTTWQSSRLGREG